MTITDQLLELSSFVEILAERSKTIESKIGDIRDEVPQQMIQDKLAKINEILNT